MSSQSYYFCVLDVEKLWFWMCLRQISILRPFCLFLSGILDIFNSPVPIAAHGSSGIVRVFVYDLYWRKLACLFCIFVLPRAVPLHWIVDSGSFHRALSLLICFRYPTIIVTDPLIHGRSLSFVHVVFVNLLVNEFCVRLRTASYFDVLKSVLRR